MADHTLRTALRRAALDPRDEAALLVEQIRAGEVSREDVELWAYLGDEAAREVAGWCCYWHASRPKNDFALTMSGCRDYPTDWLSTLLPLLETRDPLPFEVACPCRASVDDEYHCGRCKGTGTRILTIPAARWLCVHGCWTVAKEVLLIVSETARDFWTSPETLALDACAAWLKAPTEANRQATPNLLDLPEWVANVVDLVLLSEDSRPVGAEKRESCLKSCLTSATQHLPDARGVFARDLLVELKP